MSMLISFADVRSFMENLSFMIKKDELGAFREELEKLRTEATMLEIGMHEFVRGSSHYALDEEIRICMEFREVIGEAEDAVDFAYLRLKVSSGLFFRSVFPISRSRIVTKARISIERASCRVGEYNMYLLERMMMSPEDLMKHSEKPVRFQHEDDEYFANLINRSATVAKVEDERVIGFDEAVKEVVALLTPGAEHLEVISIVGMLGLGKTTLAKKVYKDPVVDYEYKIRAFVYVSSGYDKRKVLLKILTCFTQIDDKVSDRMNEEQLEKHVYQQLEGKRYLVVLDDVRDPEDWDRFKGAFPNNKDERCRVLITTRDEAVAKVANPRSPDSLYMLNFLHQESSQELFRWKVFGKNDCPVIFKKYEEKIVCKCDGYPLALVIIASMITQHLNQVNWWKSISFSLDNYIARDVKHATLVVDLTYKYLPNYLKPCLIYLATFPENFEIPVWKLLRLWIAEGFIRQKEGGFMNLEELAEQYLEVLVEINLVMVSRMRSNGRIGKCVMNGIQYEFCKKVATKENFFIEISKYNQQSDFQYPRSCRRLSINKGNVLDLISGQPSSKSFQPHSFLNYTRGETKVKPKVVSRITKNFRVLKVLEVQSLSFTIFPKKLCSLFFLKYLAISGRVESLPAALSNLWNLQTLIVESTSSALKIGVDLWKMSNFRHLHTNASASFPCRVTPNNQKSEDGEYVQTLCYISPESLKKDGFDQTTKLKKLGIRGRLSELYKANGSEFSLLPYFQKLEWLENLKLLNEGLMSSKFPGLPPKGNFPKKLAKLTLSNTQIPWKQMHTLGELENLEVLKLKEYAFVGEQWKTENGGFLRLKHLHIGRSDLMVWEASSDHFPQLRSLEINECDQLRRIPHDLADISSFQSVLLHRSTSPGVTYSLKRIRLVKFLQAKVADKRKVFEISVFPPQA